MQELLWRNVDIDKAFRRGGAGKQIGAGENARPVGLWSSHVFYRPSVVSAFFRGSRLRSVPFNRPAKDALSFEAARLSFP